MRKLVLVLAILGLTACGSSEVGGSSPSPSPTPTPSPSPTPTPSPTTCSLGGRTFTIHNGTPFSGFILNSGQVEVDVFNSNGTFEAETSDAASGAFYGTWSLSGFDLTITWTPAIPDGSSSIHHEYFTIEQENNCATITWQFLSND